MTTVLPILTRRTTWPRASLTSLGFFCALLTTLTVSIAQEESPVSLAKDIFPGAEGSGISSPVNLGGTVFFSAADGTPAPQARKLWRSNGEPGGTMEVPNGWPSPNPTELTVIGDTLYFSAFGNPGGTELWKVEGPAGAAVLVKDINPDPAGGVLSSMPRDLTDVDGTLFFTAISGDLGRELWKSNGEAAGTTLVENITPGRGSTRFSSFVRPVGVDDTLFFVVETETAGVELWKSDLTTGKTGMVKDIHPGAASSNPTNLVSFKNLLYFVADDGVHGREIWRSDGNEDETKMVADINPGSFILSTPGVSSSSTTCSISPPMTA
jgi:ELWxxDGT repeat protein